jgi:hypothetical protein
VVVDDPFSFTKPGGFSTIGEEIPKLGFSSRGYNNLKDSMEIAIYWGMNVIRE